jgi:hypothetical protein
LGQTCNNRDVVRPLAAQSGDEAPSQGRTCASVGVNAATARRSVASLACDIAFLKSFCIGATPRNAA